MRRISSSLFASSVRARLAGEKTMMLLPGCRTGSLPRMRLDWFSAMLNDRFGVRVVPRLRSRLVREECRAHVRAIDDLPQGLADVLRDVHGDPVTYRGRGGQ